MSSRQPHEQQSTLDVLLANPRPLLTCYLPVGDPLIGDHIVDAYLEGGVNIVELGMPTSDPRLDGPDVGASMRRAIQAGTGAAEFRAFSEKLRVHAANLGTVCVTYADSAVLARSTPETFEFVDAMLLLDGSQAGVDDVPTHPQRAGMRRVVFVPTQFGEHEIEAARGCDAYVMQQAADGVTGPRSDLDPANEARIRRLRAAGIEHRILLGFGISTPEQARAAIRMGADGVVIGSMCLRKALESERAIRSFVRKVRAAIDE